MGTLNLSPTDLLGFKDGIGSINIGQTNGTGAVDINASTFRDGVIIQGGPTSVTGLDAGNNFVQFFLTDAITDGGDAGTDIMGGDVWLQAKGAIGASGDSLALAVSSLLRTDTASANGNQYLAAVRDGPHLDVDGRVGDHFARRRHVEPRRSATGGDATKLTVNGATLGISDKNETVAGVTLTSGSITGSTGKLTSTSDFAVQSGTSAPFWTAAWA